MAGTPSKHVSQGDTSLQVDLRSLAFVTREVLLDVWASGIEGWHRTGDILGVTPEAAWQLPDPLLTALGLLRLDRPVRVEHGAGLLGRSRYRWELRWPAGHTPTATCLLRDGEVVVAPPAVLALPGLADQIQGADKRRVLKGLLRLQSLARRCPLIELDDRLGHIRIREATQVRVEVGGTSDAPEPSVQLIGRLEADLGDHPPVAEDRGDSSQSVDWEDDADRTPAAELEAIEVPEAALFDDLIARAAEDSVVRAGRNDFVLLDKEAFQNFVVGRAAAEQPADVRRRFVENPTAFLPAPAAFDEAHYSARVIGVGEAPAGGSAEAAPARTWAETPQGLLIELPAGPLWVDQDQLADLSEALHEGLSRGEASVSFLGAEVPCRRAVVEAVARAATSPLGASGGDDGGLGEAESGRPTVLRIQENEVVLDWAPLQRGGRNAPSPAMPLLADGVALKPHQEVALAHLRNQWSRGESGALLCDDMGLGKTIQALTFAAWVEDQLLAGGGARDGDEVALPVLVVGPPSLLEGWLAEIGRRLPTDRFPRVVWGATSLPAKSYGRDVRLLKRFRNDAPALDGSTVVLQHARLDLEAVRSFGPSVLFIGYDALRALQFAVGALRVGLVIADEAQQVKNPSSLRSHALRAMNYDFALALTGTPIENSWSDLWTLCDFATPGLLGPLAEFRKSFPASGDTREVGMRLAQTTREVLIRRTRGTALKGLPSCDIRSVECKMASDQALAYRAEVTRHNGGGRTVLGLLQGLARISLHPRLRAELSSVSQALAWLRGSARTSTLLESLHRWQKTGEAVLVFVRSKAAQATLRRALELAFDLYSVGVLNGDLSLPERQRLVGEFELDEGFRVLLVSPDVGGAGWNLQFAARSFLLERPFNPAIEAQMIARTWRLGQTRPVEVVAPVAMLDGMESFDQVLDQLLRDKRELAESVLAPAVVESKELESRFGRLFSGASPGVEKATYRQTSSSE